MDLQRRVAFAIFAARIEAFIDQQPDHYGVARLSRKKKRGLALKTDFSILGEDYRKACNFSGKEYQAYVLERDWAEFAAKNKVPAEMHLYPDGGHGYGLRPSVHTVSTWPERAEQWLGKLGVLEGKPMP